MAATQSPRDCQLGIGLHERDEGRASEVGRLGRFPPNRFGQAQVGCLGGLAQLGQRDILVLFFLEITLEIYQIVNNNKYL
jgi:hypothetical protein